MQIGCRPHGVRRCGRRAGPGLLTPARENVAFRAVRLAVQKELHGLAVGEARHRDNLALLAFPVPVREQVQHGLGGPLALVEEVAVLFEAASIQDAGGGVLGGPPALPDIVDAGPHEVPGDVVVGAHELPQLLHVQVDPSAHARAFRADHFPVRVGLLVDAVVFLFSVAKTVHVVVAHHVQRVEEFRQSARGVAADLVASHRHRPRGVFPMEEVHHLPHGLRLSPLLVHLVARAPQHHAGVIAIATDHGDDVALGPLVEVAAVGVSNRGLGDSPLVDELVHHQETHPVAQVQELGRGRIVRSPYGIAAHLFQDAQAPFPYALGHRGPHRSGFVVQADAIQLDALAV